MAPRSVTVDAYAKVNLHLDVVAKRPDGYHELVILFERVSLSDEITFQRHPNPSLKMTCEDPSLATDQTNLIMKAIREYQKALNDSFGLAISLKKRIPVGGGLGGGSSDAAATLQALQLLTDQALPDETMLSIAQKLGSDVPFFLSDTAWALGSGRGDEIQPLRTTTPMWHLLVAPDFAIPTKAVYQAFSLTAFRPDVRLLLGALRENDVSQVQDSLFNALEPTVEALYPAIRQVKAAMETIGGLRHPLVSGSGSTVVAVCASREEAFEAAEKLKGKYPSWRPFVVNTR